MLLIFLNIGIRDLGMISMPYSRVGMIDALTNVSAVSESMPHLTPESFLRILILLLAFLVIWFKWWLNWDECQKLLLDILYVKLDLIFDR